MSKPVIITKSKLRGSFMKSIDDFGVDLTKRKHDSVRLNQTTMIEDIRQLDISVDRNSVD